MEPGKIFLFFLLFFLTTVSTKAQFSTQNGFDISTTGDVAVLILFAEIDCSACPLDDFCHTNTGTNWQPGQLPPNPNDWLDPIVSQSPTTEISRLYHEASFGSLNVIGDYYSTPLTVPCSLLQITNINPREAALMTLRDEINAGNPDFQSTVNGLTLSDFDLIEGESEHGELKLQTPNNVIDLIAIIWRNNSEHANGSGLAFQEFFASPPILLPNSMNFNLVGSWVDFSGESKNLFLAEFFHPLFGGNNWHSALGAGDHTFPFRVASYGLTTQSGPSLAVCGWDRLTLGWHNVAEENQNPDPFDFATIIAKENGSLVETDFESPFSGSRTFILRDYIKTGDCIRIKLPNIDWQNLNDVKNQYLWIENRQKVSEFDKTHGEVSGCSDPWSKGLYTYIQVGKDVIENSNENIVYPPELQVNFPRRNALGSYLPSPCGGKI